VGNLFLHSDVGKDDQCDERDDTAFHEVHDL
jgi:hypothetical protein